MGSSAFAEAEGKTLGLNDESLYMRIEPLRLCGIVFKLPGFSRPFSGLTLSAPMLAIHLDTLCSSP